jgi:hypothetical protein
MKRFLTAAAAACGVALLVAATAAAKPPERFTDSFTYSGSVSCGAFDDVWEGSVELSGMTTFDQAGNPVMDVVHSKRVETNWRSDDPSVSMTLKGTWTTRYDYATDTETNIGQIYQQTYPGLGLLFHDVGMGQLRACRCRRPRPARRARAGRSRILQRARGDRLTDPLGPANALKHRNPLVRRVSACLPYRGGRTRTCNPRFWRPVLCQLSYAPRVARRL